MRRVYLDTNALENLLAEWTLEAVVRLLGSVPFGLVLGMHVMYERARAFLNENRVSAASSDFNILAELAERRLLQYQPTTEELIRAELDKAVHGLKIITVVAPLNQAAIKEELHYLARGNTERARVFISERESRHLGDRPVSVARLVAKSRELFRRRPEMRNRFATFEGYRGVARSAAWQFLVDLGHLHGRRLDRPTAERIARHLDDFPVLSTWLNCELHLSWISVSQQTAPTPSRFDDYRHLIDSATCDLLVSADGELLKRSAVLSPYRPVQSYSEWAAGLRRQFEPEA